MAKSTGWPVHGWTSLQQFLRHCRDTDRAPEQKKIEVRIREETRLIGAPLWRAVIEEMNLQRGDETAGLSGGVVHGEALRYLDELAQACVGKSGTEAEVVRFVFRHLDVDVRLIQAETVPDPGAITLLRWAKSSVENEKSFLLDLWSKMVSNKTVEAQGIFSDDTRAASRAIEQFRASLGGGA